MIISEVFKRNEEWLQEQLKEDPEYFINLRSGQKPQFLFIACSDSRVSASTVMQVKPGQVFSHRNIGNVAPNNDLNVISVVTYAVEHLQVKDIVVCGHYGCGGVAAAMKPDDLGVLNAWLRNIRDVFRLHEQELTAIKDEDKRYDRLVELNVMEQCFNVAKMKEVQFAYQEYGITIHGWVFDLGTGKLLDLGVDTKEMMDKLGNIYNYKF